MTSKMPEKLHCLMRSLPAGFVAGTGSPELCASQATEDTALLHIVSHSLLCGIQCTAHQIFPEVSSLCAPSPWGARGLPSWRRVTVTLTSQRAALLQMVDALAVVTFAQLLPDKSSHHDMHPLLPDDGILGLLDALVVVEVDPFEGWWHGRLLGQESLGLGGRHCELPWKWTGVQSTRCWMDGLLRGRRAMRRCSLARQLTTNGLVSISNCASRPGARLLQSQGASRHGPFSPMPNCGPCTKRYVLLSQYRGLPKVETDPH